MLTDFGLIITVIIGTSVILCYLYLRRKFDYWKNRNIPYDEPNILFGNVTFLMRKSFSDYFVGIKRRFPSNDYVGVYFGWQPVLLVQSPELARNILTTDYEFFTDRFTYSSYKTDPLGALNLFTVKDPTWSKVRQELSPMFTPLRLKNITDLMNVNAKELVQKIQRDHIDENEPVKLKELFSMYTSDTVGSSVFGIKVSSLNDTSSPLWYITSHMVKWTFWRGFELTMIFFIPAVAAFLRLQFFSQPATDYIKKLFWNVVEERKAVGADADSKDLVNHLLKLKNNLDLLTDGNAKRAEDLMLAQVAVFVLGAIDTSSTTITYCLHELSHHPQEQAKLYKEIKDLMDRKQKDVLDYDDLLELKYLTACILETLRKYPPSPNLDRVCNQTYKLNDDVTVEKGTPVFVNVVGLHYDEKLFPEPHEWRPERMANVQEADNLQFSYLPFGDGPRLCIGKRYGMMQVRAALAQMIAKYRVLPDLSEPYVGKTDPYAVLLAPLSGGRVKFAQR